MKFTCEKYLLSMAVSTAGRAAASKSPVPALEGLLLEAGESGVRVTGFDLKKGIYTGFAADVSEPGSVVISARLFGEIVRKLPDGIVTVASDEYNTVNVRCGNADYNVAGTPAEDYPELPAMDHGSRVVMPQDTLASMISQTRFAISTTESRPVYTGALLEVEKGMMTMVAVDGYRLALRREETVSCDVDLVRFIVPGTALGDVEKICQSEGDNVTITVGSKHVCFSVGETVLITRWLEGEFLNYRKTVPFEFPIQLKAKKADMIRCADRVSLIIDDRTKNPLRCTFGDGRLSIACATPLGRAEDSCELEGNGGDMVIGFNNSYLMDALKAAPEEELIVNLISGASPCVLTPEDGSEKFLYMILPVRLRAE
ncbi:MAG: DNA polymerase III subunit beta [Oscillospiraceae bacterium]|nr:DNA polymerase III subunit beta [Oscillospiraceae bacterium]